MGGNGKTPLHVIVESGKEWGYVETVFLANPNAIIVEDSQGKVPFIAAALCFCDDNGISNYNMVEDELVLINGLSLAPSASSCNGSSAYQCTDSTVITTTTKAIEKLMSPSSQSYISNYNMVEDELVLINGLSLAPSGSSWSGSSAYQGTDSTVITTTTKAIEELISPSSQSYCGERSDTLLGDPSMSQLDVLYKLLMA